MRFIDAWSASLQSYGDNPYLSGPNFNLCGSEALETLQKYTAALIAQGLKPGDTIAFYGRADAEWLLVQMAVMKAGGTVAMIPHVDDEAVLVRLFSQSNPKYLFASTEEDADRCVRCMKAMPQVVQTILQHGAIRNPAVVSLPPLVKSGELLLRDKPEELTSRAETIQPDDIAVVMYSTGTMGFPRSVAISHKRLESQVRAVADELGRGPALFSSGMLELIDHSVLLWAGIRAGREIVFGKHPDRPWEWVGTAPEIADAIFSVTWPPLGPAALPHGFARWRLDRKLATFLKNNFRHLAGVHTGFSVLPEPIIRQIQRARMRLTWGYGLVEAHGFCTWEENGKGFGTVLPQIKLATHAGKLAFDFSDNPTAWWQSTGDWARTVGPWIMELEPHGSERGEVLSLVNARKVERELNNHPWIAASFVAGPEPMANAALLSLRSHPVFAWSQAEKIRDGSWESLLERPQLSEPLLQRVRAIGHKHGMALEPVILKRGLSPETGEVTPRGELRRALILRRAGSYVQTKRPQ